MIRRLSFDLHGLPPSPEAVAAFVDSPDLKAYEKLVDPMLVSPHYGERFARDWTFYRISTISIARRSSFQIPGPITILASSALTHLAQSGIHGIAEKVFQRAKNVDGPAEHDGWAPRTRH